MMIKPVKIDVLELMLPLDRLLLHVLDEMSPEDWERQTVAQAWKVRDVALHLLDGNFRTLSMLRDGYFGEASENITSYDDLVRYLNLLNSDWVTGTRRLSSKVIVSLLRSSGKEYCDFLATLNPEEKALFSVAWAGETISKNWFHIAREYTEKWHHQQQIRLAVGKDKELLQEKWYLPYLDTCVRALPHHFKDVNGKYGEVIKFIFEGENEKNWYLHFSGVWELYTSVSLIPVCEVRIKDDIAWRIFTKGIRKEEAIARSVISGNEEYGLKIFDMVAVVA